jgi:hypothetical protein
MFLDLDRVHLKSRSSMKSSLELLFEAIRQTDSREELRSHIGPKIGDYFAATRKAIFSSINCP